MTKLRLGFVILYVPQVEEAMAFYEKAFGLHRRFLHESGEYGEMETGDTALAFAKHDAMPMTGGARSPHRDDPAPPFEIAFVVADVAAAYADAIRAGATAVAPPVEKPWGQTVSYMRDVNGFLVELCTVVSS